jgi:anti-anti-sigma regulatory factor
MVLFDVENNSEGVILEFKKARVMDSFGVEALSVLTKRNMKTQGRYNYAT